MRNKFEQSVHNIQNVPSWLRSSIMIVPLLVMFYWMYSFSGLYRWYTNIQLNRSGEYEESTSFFLTFLSLMIPAISLLLIVAYKKYNIDVSDKEQQTPLIKNKTFMEKVDIISQRNIVWFLIYLGLSGISLFTIVISLIIFINNYSISSTPIIVDINNNTLVKEGRNEYITITGRPSCDELNYLEETETKNGSTKRVKKQNYIPLYNKNGAFSFIFLEKTIYKKEAEYECVNNSEITVTGIISSSPLPGVIRDEYLASGLIKEGEPYSILDINRSKGPNKDSDVLFLIGAISGILLLIIDWKMRLFADEKF